MISLSRAMLLHDHMSVSLDILDLSDRAVNYIEISKTILININLILIKY